MGSDTVFLGDAIRSARINKGFTQEYLAEKLEITTGHLQHIERGFRNPSVPMLFHIMAILDMSVDNLVFNRVSKSLSVEGLSLDQITALANLISTMKNTKNDQASLI